jgi:hypothetical protein
MEQTTQQIIQKPSLSIKTKIAAWWIGKKDRRNFLKIAS